MTAPNPTFRSSAALLALSLLAAGCAGKHTRATSVIADDLSCLVEDRPGHGDLVRVQSAPVGALEDGPLLMTVQPFDDLDGDFQLDDGEELGEPLRVGNGKSASPRLATGDFELPQARGGDALLSIRIDSRAGRTTWSLWRDPESGFWKRVHASRAEVTRR